MLPIADRWKHLTGLLNQIMSKWLRYSLVVRQSLRIFYQQCITGVVSMDYVTTHEPYGISEGDTDDVIQSVSMWTRHHESSICSDSSVMSVVLSGRSLQCNTIIITTCNLNIRVRTIVPSYYRIGR